MAGRQIQLALDRILLDTQAFLIAAVQGTEGFSRKLRTLLENPLTDRCLSTVSITELAIKVSIGRLDLTMDLVSEAVRDLRLTVLPFTSQHAYNMFQLPLHHRDPFDRMLIAVATAENMPIASGDRQFPKYRGTRVIW